MSYFENITNKLVFARGAEAAEELARRERRRLCLSDPVFLTKRLLPPERLEFSEFWKRYGEVQEWMSWSLLRFRERGVFEMLPGLEVIEGDGELGRSRRLVGWEEVDFSRYLVLMIRLSRETLKSGVMRCDFVGSLLWWAEVRGVTAASVWSGHKEPMVLEAKRSICAMMRTEGFADDWSDYVPRKGGTERWGKADRFDTLRHPDTAPEPAAVFLAAGQSYTGGRYRQCYIDDLVTKDDAVSPAVRVESQNVLDDRMQERDKTQGIVAVAGTDYHPDDAYQSLQRKRGVLTVRMPCLLGSTKSFFEFCDLTIEQRKNELPWWEERCRPPFKSLGLETLAEIYGTQSKTEFATQMLLDCRMGGRAVFETERIATMAPEDIPDGLPAYGFLDAAFKIPENRFEGDFCAGCVVVFDKFGRRIVVDGFYRDDWGHSETFAEMASIIKRWKVIDWFTEDAELSEQNPESRWFAFAVRNGLPILTLRMLERAGKANKMGRIKGLEPELRAGRLLFVRDHPFTAAFINEAAKYSAIRGGSHDDALDAVAQSYDPAVGSPNGQLTNRTGSDRSSSDWAVQLP